MSRENQLVLLKNLLQNLYNDNNVDNETTTALYDAIKIFQIKIDTDFTKGKNKYLVALQCGGLMEDPEFHLENYQVICADSEEEAVKKYNEINQCNFYYGKVVQKL